MHLYGDNLIALHGEKGPGCTITHRICLGIQMCHHIGELTVYTSLCDTDSRNPGTHLQHLM